MKQQSNSKEVLFNQVKLITKNNVTKSKVVKNVYLLQSVSLSLLVTLALMKGHPIQAQVVGDTTLPVGSQSQVSGNPNFLIDGGARQGNNLFHSFSQFSIPTGGSAFFNNAIDVQNIFSRVTGGSASIIDGAIRTNGTANLFLLNPNGILFGPNASLNLQGSFLATTGNSIRFADGAEFSAIAPTPLMLTVSVPIGVQFGTNTPKSIQVNGSLLQSSGRTIGFLGGDITVMGGNRGLAGNDVITTSGGRIGLGSVGSNSFVGLAFANQGFTFRYDQVQEFRTIQLLQNASIGAGSGGNIDIQGSHIQLADGSQVYTFNTTNVPGGTLTINASESVSVLGTGRRNSREVPTRVFNLGFFTSNAGTIAINTRQFLVQNGGQVFVGTQGTGAGGDLIVNASETVDVSGVSPTQPSIFSAAYSYSDGDGNAGNLLINTNTLKISNGGQVSTTAFGNGQGGNLTVNAVTVQLTGGSADQVNGLFAQAGSSNPLANTPDATGQGGNLTINTGMLVVQNGSRVSAGTFDAGRAGNLVINASSSVQVMGRSVVDQSPSLLNAGSASSGAAGNLSVSTRRLTVEDGGRIAVSGTSTGVAGNLQITSPFIQLNNQGVLAAETTAGQGNITLNTSDLRLRRNSLISTNATGSATGGNIAIATQTLVALENSDITANAEESFGGRVSIQAKAIFGTKFRPQLTSESDITATSALGPQFSGLVTIQTPGIDPSQGLVQLQTEVVDLSRLVAEACSPASRQASGEFFMTGRGGLPLGPTDPPEENSVLEDLGKPLGDRSTRNSIDRSSAPPTPSSDTTELSTVPPLVQAQGWVVNSRGRVVLLARSSNPPLQDTAWSLPVCSKQ